MVMAAVVMSLMVVMSGGDGNGAKSPVIVGNGAGRRWMMLAIWL